jgi:hypothetical protein
MVVGSCPHCGTMLLANLVRELEEKSAIASLEAAYHTECHRCDARLRRRPGQEWEMWGRAAARNIESEPPVTQQG